MSKRPLAIWIALAIQLLYAIFFLAVGVFQFSFISGLEADDPDRVFSLIRMSVAFPIGIIAIITIAGLYSRKNWSKWMYEVPAIALPLIDLLDWAFYQFREESEGIADLVIFVTMMILFYVPLLAGFLLITVGTRAKQYFGNEKTGPESFEPPPPPVFELE
jgi:hypothetical protein